MSSRTPIRVLHVDDDPEFADLVAVSLEREDDRIEVVTAHDAAEGLERLSAADAECVVSDFDMPGTDGLAFLDSVREEHPSLPFVLFTGKGSEEIASRAVSAGVTDYLQKRGGSEQYAVLANRVRNAVARHRAERQADRGYRALETAFGTGEATLDVDLVTNDGVRVPHEFRLRRLDGEAGGEAGVVVVGRDASRSRRRVARAEEAGDAPNRGG